MGAAQLPPPAPARSRRGLLIAGACALVLAGVVVVSAIASRSHKVAQTQSWTTSEAIPALSVVQPTVNAGARSLSLPGQLQAFYSRVSGYVQAWYDDIGARVKKGQLLAVIDTPETDQQIIQARADLATAQANMNLASTTAQRWSRLLKQDAVSAQESEEKAGDFVAKTAQVQAARAALDRYLALKGFSRITAPFDGVITARRIDIGALVNAGAGATPNSELFDVAKVDHLRLYVRVPQVDSAEIKPGVTASLSVPERPGRSFPARRRAVVAASKAAFALASADYRATVLTAFQQVEDGAGNHYAAEQVDEADAVKAAQATTHLSLIRYREGAANYLEVVTAQTAELQSEQTLLALQTRRQRESGASARGRLVDPRPPRLPRPGRQDAPDIDARLPEPDRPVGRFSGKHHPAGNSPASNRQSA